MRVQNRVVRPFTILQSGLLLWREQWGAAEAPAPVDAVEARMDGAAEGYGDSDPGGLHSNTTDVAVGQKAQNP